MAGSPILDAPWTGTTFQPPTALDIAAIEGAIVDQLKAALGNVIEVTHFPDRPEVYELRHRVGVAMVIFLGSAYSKEYDVGNVVQERTMEFGVGIRIRDLGWAFGGPASGPSPGAYQILEGVRVALTGFQPNTGCTKMRPTRERFVQRAITKNSMHEGTWVYEMRFETRTAAVEEYQAPTFPLFVLGTANEGLAMYDAAEGPRVPAITVKVESLTFVTDTLSLQRGDIGIVVVKSRDLATTYIEQLDYVVDYSAGTVTRFSNGAIASQATVAVSYGYGN